MSEADGEHRGLPGGAKVRAVSGRAKGLSRRGREWGRSAGSCLSLGRGAWGLAPLSGRGGTASVCAAVSHVLVAVLPALLVMEDFLDPHPNSLAARLVHHFHLNAPTSVLFHGVLGEGRKHELGSALFAIAGALFFGLGFGRVLQLVHARAGELPLPKRAGDQALYATVLLGLYGLLLVLLVQLDELRGDPSWVGFALAVGWIGLLVLFFVWAPWLLTHKRITRRDLFPSAALTAFALVVLMMVSRYVMQFWVDLYAKDYGGLGVVLALYFWILLSAGIIVWAASLSPALAARRDRRRAL